MAILTFWSNLFFSFKLYVIYSYIIWLVEETFLKNTAALLLPLLLPVYSVQVAIQLTKNFIYGIAVSMASYGVSIVPY